MNISNNPSQSKPESSAVLAFLPKGNLVPHEWYHAIKTKAGKVDLPALSILSEIVFRFRPQKIYDYETDSARLISNLDNGAWQTSYRYFEQLFGYNRQRVRRALVNLEELGIIKREFRTITINKVRRPSILFICLYSSTFAKLFVAAGVSNNNTRNNNQDNSYSTPQSTDSSVELSDVWLQNCSPTIYSKKNKYRYLSSESKFKNELKKITTEDTETIKPAQSIITLPPEDNESIQVTTPGVKTTSTIARNTKKLRSLKKLKPSAFHPLTEDEASFLRNNSGREFILHYMNQHVLMLDRKLDHLGFYSRKDFLTYMTSSLRNELRQAVLVNNESFKLCHNLQEREIEKYLSMVEHTRITCNESILRRKIAGRFEPKLAYDILRSTVFTLSGAVMNLKIIHPINLGNEQKQILLNEIKAVYGNHIEHLNIEVANYIVRQEKDIDTCSMRKNSKTLTNAKTSTEFNLPDSPLPLASPSLMGFGIWGKIRKKLQDYYGMAIDRSWFSKLIIEEDTEKKQLTLKAPSDFYSSYIQQNYGQIIEQYCQAENYQLTGLSV